MKTYAILTIAALNVLASHAFAFGAQDFTLDCRSTHNSVKISIERSEADGIFLTSVSFRGAAIDTEKTLTVQKKDDAPSKIAFVAQDKIVSLVLREDMITAALKTESKALIIVDGRAEIALCR